MFDVAIIGGGFSGIAVAAAMARHGGQAAIVEPSATLPGGLPFAAASDWHLLNVRAARMSLYADAPDDFTEFCSRQFGGDHSHYQTQFVSRPRYAQYLRQRVGQLRHVRQIIDRAVAIIHQGDHFRVQTAQSVVAARHVVLALGAPVKAAAITDPRWLVGPWPLRQLPAHDQADIALIIGSGLSAVDAVQTLLQLGWRGRIWMRSTHALLPAVHAGPDLAAWLLPTDFAEQATDARAFLRLLREQLQQAQAKHIDWRAVIHALRPITATIFSSWSPATRSKIMRRLAWLWTPHRHRMAAEVHAVIEQARRSGQLEIAAARLVDAKANTDGVHCRFANGESLCAALVIDARAPNDAVLAHPLLQQLHAQNLIRAQSNHIETDGHGCAARIAGNQIFALGALRYGQLLETTAVPEIRQQAQAIADQLRLAST